MKIRVFCGATRLKACERVIGKDRKAFKEGCKIRTKCGTFQILSQQINLHWKKSKRQHIFNTVLA